MNWKAYRNLLLLTLSLTGLRPAAAQSLSAEQGTPATPDAPTVQNAPAVQNAPTTQQAPAAQSDTLFLPVSRLFELGVQQSLRLQADALEENAARIREEEARAGRLPDLSVGLRGGFAGQPVIFRQGLREPYRPDSPDWSQNYAVDFSQPLYQGGKIRHAIRRAGQERTLAALKSQTDAADLKLSLLEQYMQLFSLYREQEVLSRNIEESERRLHDIRRMK